MKVANQNQAAVQKFTVNPPIPFESAEKSKDPVSDEKLFKTKIHTTPGDANTPTYTKSVAYFGSGTNEEWLITRKGITDIVSGLNLTSGATKYQLARQILKGDALRTFNQAATTRGDESNENFPQCLNDVTASIFPLRAAQTQKRYMRRDLRKPRSMKIREFRARLHELNEYLALFPGGTSLAGDEIKDILEFASPHVWRTKMLEQGFNPLDHTTNEYVDFCERLETAEMLSQHMAANQKKPSNGTESNTGRNGGKRKGSKSNADTTESSTSKKKSRNGQDKYCPLHKTYGHDANDCKVIQAQVKNMSATWDAQHKDGKSSNRSVSKGKTSYNKEELHALVDARVKAITKKKRKVEFKDDDEDDHESNALTAFDDMHLGDDDEKPDL